MKAFVIQNKSLNSNLKKLWLQIKSIYMYTVQSPNTPLAPYSCRGFWTMRVEIVATCYSPSATMGRYLCGRVRRV